MIEILCSKSSITVDTTFRKFYPAGGTNSNTRTINLEKNQMKTQRGITTDHSQDSYLIPGGHPTKLPATNLAGSETDPEVCANGCKRLGTRKCDCACRCHENIPHLFLISIGAPRAIVNKAVKHGISTIW